MDLTTSEKNTCQHVNHNKQEELEGGSVNKNNHNSDKNTTSTSTTAVKNNTTNTNTTNTNNNSKENSSNTSDNNNNTMNNESHGCTWRGRNFDSNYVSDFNMSVFEDKFCEFVMRTEYKLDVWLESTLKQFQNTQNKMITVVQGCANCQALERRYDKALKVNIEWEKEVVALEDDAKMKDSVIQDLQKEIKSLSKELVASNNRLSDLSVASNSSGFEAKIIQMEIMTSKQNLQIAALQEQNNVLAAQNKLKDQVIRSKQKEVDNLSHQMQKRVVEKSREVKYVQDQPCGGDVLLIHDLPQYRRFNIALLRSSNTTVTELWKTQLNDALTYVKNMEKRPKAVIVHTGNEDLVTRTEDEMVNIVVKIYEELYQREVKFIWSNIQPRGDDFEMQTKGYFVNIKVGKELSHRKGAYVGCMEDFCLRDMLNEPLLDVISE